MADGMVTGVCLNPCIDKTVDISAFAYGGMNRILSSRSDGSGKGVNIALCARTLGHAAACLGFLYEENGAMIEKRLREAGADCAFAWAPGQVRTNLKIFDRSQSCITEVNEPGLSPSPKQLCTLERLVDEYADRSAVMVFTGSLPPGLDNTYYAHLMRIVNGRCLTVLDAEGEKLLSGLALRPALIKPNTYELETIAGRKLNSLEEIRLCALELIQKGAKMAAVSMGGDGAMLVTPQECWYAPCIPVAVRSTVGAGDSMVIGLLHAMLQGECPREILRMGVAAATAAVTTEGTQLFTKDGFTQMLDRVELKRIG